MKIPVEPLAKQSARFNPVTGSAYQPAKVKKYVLLLKEILKAKMPLDPYDGTLEIMVCFSFPWLSKHTKKQRAEGYLFKSTKPDLDNLCKPLFDAMNGIIIKDDGRLSRVDACKIYSDEAYISVILSRV